MDLGLKGKKALVTGGSRGIGRAIADLLADEGADVAICARNADQVAEAVKALEAKGVKAFGKAVDIADGPAIRAFITEAGETLGGIDVMVSNASALVQGAGEDEWRAMFEIDILGAVRSFEAARPFLEKAAETHGDAAFLITSSVSAAETNNASSYGAMKAALIHYAKGLARENAAKHIRANVVSPGTVFFEGGVWGNVKAGMPQFFDQMIKRNPTGRMATPEEVAAATVFLASPRSAFTTGINMLVDGAISSRVNY
ncbi:3-ketoacyl-ACP reductase [Phenylobacterium sp. Root77]|uniref:SDR family NAD(P)-dependent oxidoreductase n=1 Tax=unclassified Phenylobacterium TaxID=2640670 RepID=UPI0006FD7D2E|nr:MULTISPECIES: SDR family oxidoreductase [unclassified Phenylobacterium]KQW66482.1 3-ketoacyl-ACP reductase [Phenylobacterium sp. Root1277]KQW88988.1 3-ketoacyl-ACP reductase [Phenylobacterium sp. Root1290]KRC42156.1 3-ketoacyl-ACP reductase [Phenylobacterium sp. Root77]